jgi:hypothetical protein
MVHLPESSLNCHWHGGNMGLKEEDHSKMKERKRLILLKSFTEAMVAI